jgi:riboflavin kinase / FMN adenylyltransferase
MTRRLPGQDLHVTAPSHRNGSIAVIGEFDGFHVGHSQLASIARRIAGRSDSLCAIVLHRGAIERQLTTLAERLTHLRRAGIETAIAVDASAQWTDIERAIGEAIDSLRIRTAILACAPDLPTDLRWGSLRPSLHRRHVEIVEVPRARDDSGRAVTSAQVRDRLAAGAVDDVATLLGRYFSISGVVAHGDERGRTIGFPTANLAFDRGSVWPAFGVYAGWVTIDGQRHASAVNIGNRPTIYGSGGVTMLEAHVLDFTGDLYDLRIEVELVARLRDEQRFESLGELKAQLALDVRAARGELHPSH